MTGIVRMHAQGAPDVLRYEQIDIGAPGPGQVRIRQTAIGINFLDVYLRSGDMPISTFPFVNGFEAAGVVDAVGAGVDAVSVGDRVAYQLVGGAYAESRLLAPDRLVRLPDTIDDVTAAAVMLKGTTAEFLVRQVHPVGSNDVVLVHAAAGGVGKLVSQWAHALGATVIGTVGSSAKRNVALAHGCDHVIVNDEEDFVDRVREITNGEGVSVVYDGVGKSTFTRNFDALRRFGKAVLFGWSSGRVPPVDVHALNAKSLSIVNPSVAHYTATREQLERSTQALFEILATKAVTVSPQVYALSEAATAHADLEGRRTTGSVVLKP